MGRNSSKLLPKGLRKWYRNALQAVLARGEAEHFQYSETDSSYWEVRIVPLHSARSLNSAMVIATDVTERRPLEAQAIRSARFATLGVLSASVAHEVNNPNKQLKQQLQYLMSVFAVPLGQASEEALEQAREQGATGAPRPAAELQCVPA